MKNIKQKFLASLTSKIHFDHQAAFLAHEGTIENYFDTHENGAEVFFLCVYRGLLDGPFAHIATYKRIDACAEKDPSGALICAASLLTVKRLEACAEQHPYTALMHAADLVNDSRFKALAMKYPRTALDCATERLKLDSATYQYCKMKAPNL